jgi:ABC-type multidrug transport system fused ATPase/permease subunit
MINKFFFVLNSYSKKYFFFIFFLMFLVSLLETLSIGALIPLVSYIFKIDKNFFILNYRISEELIFILFAFFFIIKNFFSIYYSKKYFFFLGMLTVFFQKKLFINSLNLEENNVTKKNPAELIQIIKDEVSQFTNEFVDSLLLILLNVTLVILIFILLIFYDPLLSFFIFVILLIFSLIASFKTKKIFINFGKRRNFTQVNLFRYLRDTFQSLKELKLYNRQHIFLDKFDTNNREYVNITTRSAVANLIPKLVVETIFIVFLIILIFFKKDENNLNELLASISVFIFAAYKLIPSFLIIVRSYQRLSLSKHSLETIFTNALIEDESNFIKKEFIFNQKIEFIDVNFSYGEKLIFDGLNFTINRGSFIGIYGKSGYGKSTFVDLITGLLLPTKGRILVDGININENIYGWRDINSILPQKNFLFDDSLLMNITLETDISKIDHNLLQIAIKESFLNETINYLPDGIMTNVGDLGKKFSGGQLQRIMLARALYFNKKILILDEPTTGFDSELENNFINNLNKLKNFKTIILITHNLKILKQCDFTYKLENYNLIKKNVNENIF